MTPNSTLSPIFLNQQSHQAQYMYHLSQLTPIPFSIRLPYLLDLHFMSIKNRPQQSTFIYHLHSTFSTKAYILYNINTKHITI